MKRSNVTVTYLFRLTKNADLQKAKRGLLPKDYFYYYHYVSDYFHVRAITLLSTSLIKFLNLFNDYFLRFFLHFDFPLFTLLPHLFTLRGSQIIFATTPKIGIAVACLKKLRLIKGELVINILGLYDQISTLPADSLVLRLIELVFVKNNIYVSGASQHEIKVLSRFLHLPIKNFHFLPYCGVDSNYYSPGKKFENFIFALGVDPARDWKLYHKVALALPEEKFIWATDPKQLSMSPPSNVRVEYLTEKKLLSYMQTAKIVLILTKQNHHFSGVGTLMRAMSCGRPVIVTETKGIEEYDFKHLKHCILVKPNSLKQVASFIKRLSTDQILVKKLSKNSARLIRRKHQYKQVGKHYVKLFNTLRI